jgi:hypothetical protein
MLNLVNLLPILTFFLDDLDDFYDQLIFWDIISTLLIFVVPAVIIGGAILAAKKR